MKPQLSSFSLAVTIFASLEQKIQRAKNIAAIENRLNARNIKVIVFDDTLPTHYYQFDGIHFTTEGHSEIASRLLPVVISAFDPQNR